MSEQEEIGRAQPHAGRASRDQEHAGRASRDQEHVSRDLPHAGRASRDQEDVSGDQPHDPLLANSGVVVTGAGQGIGEALARRFAEAGARVVVNDLDAAKVEKVAADIGGLAVPGDSASVAGVAALIEAARTYLGPIDVYVANAGVDHGVGLDASENDWATSLDVNVMAHVRAARLLIPEWVERGSGRFVVTASAAGLLTMLGAPAYSVSKHAAVAFAEWLEVTYAHRGVSVHAICPQGVDTRMYAESGPLKDLLSRDALLSPQEVAEALMDAIGDDRFFVLPHAEVAGYYAARATDPARWMAGMNALQRRLEETA